MKKGFFLLALLVASTVYASCNYLTVTGIREAVGVQAKDAFYSFPLMVTNTGQNSQLVQLSGECPDKVYCRFEPSAYDTLAPSQSKTFTLVAQTSDSGNFSIPIRLAESTSFCSELTLNLAVTPNASTSSAVSLTASINPQTNTSSRPGEKVSYDVTLTNSGPEKIFASIENPGTFKDTTFFSLVDFELQPSEVKTITATITVPPGTPYGKYYPVFLVKTVTNSGCCEKTFTFPSQLFVYSEKLNLVLQGEPVTCINAPQTERRNLNLSIRNDGEVEGPFTFEIQANKETKDIVALEKTLMEIKMQDRQPLYLALTPSLETPLATYNYNLVAKYLDYTVFQRPYCFKVTAKTDFETTSEEEYTVIRGELNELNYKIENTGTASLEFIAEPIPKTGFQLTANPLRFSLPAKQSLNAKLLVATNLATSPLGKTNLTVRLRTSNVTKAVDFPIRVVSSTTPGNSFITISQTPLTAISGIESTQFVEVLNKKSTGILHSVNVSVLGIPSDWVIQKTPPLDILPGRTAQIELLFKIPQGEKKDFNVSLAAESLEGERTSRNVKLSVLEPMRRLDHSITNLNYQDDGNKVLVTIRVVNSGLVPLTKITPQLSGYVVSTESGAFSLDPGESKEIALTITKEIQSTPTTENDIPLLLTSSEGISTSVIAIPTRPSQKEETISSWLFTAIIVMALVLVALAFFIRKEKLEQNYLETI